jgi:hypothetical protein
MRLREKRSPVGCDDPDGTNFNTMSWNEDRQGWFCVFGPMGAIAPTREKIEELISERSRIPVDQWDFTFDGTRWSAYPRPDEAEAS